VKKLQNGNTQSVKLSCSQDMSEFEGSSICKTGHTKTITNTFVSSTSTVTTRIFIRSDGQSGNKQKYQYSFACDVYM
jgi:hypothetical protein